MLLSAVFLCLCILMATQASALTIEDSSNFDVDLNDRAYITNNNAPSSLFSSQLISMNDGTASGTVAFSQIPYFDFDDTLYFQFVYDMQETGGPGQRQISIDAIQITVVGSEFNPFWVLGETYRPIILNSAAPYTSTPLGAGGDMALYVPVSLFHNKGLTGSNLLTLTVTQSQSDNGADEWVVLGSGSGGSYIDPDDPIPPGVVPLPPSVLLLGSGLLGLWGWKRFGRG
jgi:hypothetical protein